MTRQKSILLIGFFVLVLLACQAAAGLPNPFATATPTSTPTFTPTPTPSSTPTPTFTPTPPPSGRVKEKQSDGTTLFTDYDGGYRIIAPLGWTAVLLTKADIDQLVNNLPANSPEIDNMKNILNSADQKTYRAFFFNFANISRAGQYTPDMAVTLETSPMITRMSMDELVRAYVQGLPQILKGLKILHSEVNQTSAGIQIGVLEATWSLALGSRNTIPLYERVVLFTTDKGVVSIAFAVPTEIKDKLLPDFNQVVESIRLLK